MDKDKDKELERLKKENRELKRRLKRIEKEKEDNDAWEFHWDGKGSYEESRRCFYGDFS